MKRLLLAFMITLISVDFSFSQGRIRHDFDFHGYSAFVIQPAEPAPGSPWIWVMPAWLVDADAHELRGGKVFDYYIEAALAKGITVAGVEIGVTFGSPVAAAFNHTFYKYVREQFKLARKPRLLLQSNGALTGFRWAYQHPRLVDRIAGIYPVLHLNSWPERRFLEGVDNLINPAWAFMPPEKINYVFLKEMSPIALMHRIHAPTLFVAGTEDTVVPAKYNAILATNTYPDHIETIRVKGLGHQIAPQFHQNKQLARFLTK